MENLSIGTSRELGLVSADTTTTYDISEEFVLPDYVPEIRKLLCTKAQVLPESRYVQGGKLELGGTVTYLIIYTDDEGSLCGTTLSSSYETQIPFDEGQEGIDLTVVDNVNVRVNAQRRLTVKSRLKTRLVGHKREQIQERIAPRSTADEMYLERDILNTETFEICKCSLDNIRMSDTLESSDNQTTKPLWCDAFLVITDTKSQNGSVSARGKVQVKCVCQGNEGIVVLTKELPLAEEIECDECKAGDSVRVMGRCVSLSISNETGEGSNKLFFDICCELECEVLKKHPCSLTRDCYSTKYETEAAYCDKELYNVAKMGNTTFTLNEVIKQKNGEIAEIVEKIATPVLEKAEIKGNKLILNGKITGAVIGKGQPKEDGSYEYVSQGMDVPFKYEYDLGKPIKEHVIRASVDIGNVALSGDGEKINITAELYPAFTVYEKTRERVLDSAVIKKDKEIKKDASSVTAYFPKGSDTLWEIAKRFHTTVSKITEDNESTDKTVLIV